MPKHGPKGNPHGNPKKKKAPSKKKTATKREKVAKAVKETRRTRAAEDFLGVAVDRREIPVGEGVSVLGKERLAIELARRKDRAGRRDAIRLEGKPRKKAAKKKRKGRSK